MLPELSLTMLPLKSRTLEMALQWRQVRAWMDNLLGKMGFEQLLSSFSGCFMPPLLA